MLGLERKYKYVHITSRLGPSLRIKKKNDSSFKIGVIYGEVTLNCEKNGANNGADGS